MLLLFHLFDCAIVLAEFLNESKDETGCTGKGIVRLKFFLILSFVSVSKHGFEKSSSAFNKQCPSPHNKKIYTQPKKAKRQLSSQTAFINIYKINNQQHYTHAQT